MRCIKCSVDLNTKYLGICEKCRTISWSPKYLSIHSLLCFHALGLSHGAVESIYKSKWLLSFINASIAPLMKISLDVHRDCP